METPARLIVDVARLDAGGEAHAGETDPAALDLGDRPGTCAPVGGILYDLRVERLGSELLARGRVSPRLRCTCSRCAEPFATEVAEPRFAAALPLTDATEFVDLTPEMREAIILLLPGYPVCREDCKGLCARCGADLNREACTCPPGGAGPLATIELPAGKEKET